MCPVLASRRRSRVPMLMKYGTVMAHGVKCEHSWVVHLASAECVQGDLRAQGKRRLLRVALFLLWRRTFRRWYCNYRLDAHGRYLYNWLVDNDQEYHGEFAIRAHNKQHNQDTPIRACPLEVTQMRTQVSLKMSQGGDTFMRSHAGLIIRH